MLKRDPECDERLLKLSDRQLLVSDFPSQHFTEELGDLNERQYRYFTGNIVR